MANTFDIWVMLGFKDKASPKMKDATKNMQDMAKTAAKIGIAAAAAAVALKKIYDTGKQGAAIAQTTESFDRLGVSIQEMRKASLGTIDDMTLMSSTLTLTAGASESLQAELLSNAPQLLTIAKAANKLNPTLGDTASMYESIATGIKRSSPLILDNLGIVVKVSQANEDYAAQIGKTVLQLTAEEKQMALLNATMKAGDRLIEQVGGSTEALGDSYAETEANIKNITAAMKVNVAKGINPAISRYAEMLTNMQELKEEHGAFKGTLLGNVEALGIGTTAFYEYQRAAKAAKDELQQIEDREIVPSLTQDMYELRTSFVQAAPPIYDSAGAVDQYNQAIANADIAAMAAIAQKMSDQANAAEALAVGTLKAAAGLGEMSQAQFKQNFVDMLEAAGANSDELRSAMLAFGLITPEEVKIMKDLEKAVVGVLDNTLDLAPVNAMLGGWAVAAAEAEEPMSKLNVAGMDTDEWVANLTGVDLEKYLNDTEGALDSVQEPMENFATTVGDGAKNAFDLDANVTSLAEDGITEFEAALSRAQAPMADFSGVVGDGAANARDLNSYLDDLPDSHTFTLHLNTVGSLPSLPSGPDSSKQGSAQEFANGGFLPTGGSGFVGEAGMERITAVPGGVQITPMTTTNNNFDVTVNTRATSGTYIQDIMQAQALAQ